MRSARGVSLADLFGRWLHAPILTPNAAKEIRTLFPVWLLTGLVTLLAPLLGRENGYTFGVLAYALGSVILGALSFGHEYTHGTLGVWLAQPMSRQRLLGTKVAVLATALAVLGALRAVEVLATPGASSGEWSLVLIPVLSALLVAPWLTLLTRSPLAGTVFTFALPGLFWLAARLLATATASALATPIHPVAESFVAVVFWIGLLAHWVLGGYFGWRKFIQLQAIEGRGVEVRLPRWLRWQTRATAVTLSAKKRPVLWCLVKKELQLQTIALVLTGVYLLAWVSAVIVQHFQPPLHEVRFMMPTTWMYAALMPLLLGAVASAEERQLGTAEWQVLFPMAAWKQWTVKVGTVFGLTLLLGALLPLALQHLASVGDVFALHNAADQLGLVGFTLCLATVSLYASSVCRNTVQAAIVSLGVAAVPWLILSESISTYVKLLSQPSGVSAESLISHGAFGLVHMVMGLMGLIVSLPVGPDQSLAAIPNGFFSGLLIVLAVGLLALILRFALTNHRSAERGAGRFVRQVLWIAGYILVAAALSEGILAVRLAAREILRLRAEAVAWSQLAKVGKGLHAYVKEHPQNPLLQPGGKVTPQLRQQAAGVDWNEVELLVMDNATLRKVLTSEPRVIVATWNPPVGQNYEYQFPYTCLLADGTVLIMPPNHIALASDSDGTIRAGPLNAQHGNERAGQQSLDQRLIKRYGLFPGPTRSASSTKVPSHANTSSAIPTHHQRP